MSTLPDLMRLFDFTAEDLSANRTGWLSDRQLARIEADRLQASIEKASSLVAVSLVLVFTLVYLGLAYRLGEALGPWILALIAAWFIAAVAIANLAQRLLRGWLRRSAHDRGHWLLRRLGSLDKPGDEAARTGRVIRFEGVLTKVDDGEHTPHTRLDDEEFMDSASVEVDERLWAIAPGFRYAFYALPDVLWVVSVEPATTAR